MLDVDVLAPAAEELDLCLSHMENRRVCLAAAGFLPHLVIIQKSASRYPSVLSRWVGADARGYRRSVEVVNKRPPYRFSKLLLAGSRFEERKDDFDLFWHNEYLLPVFSRSFNVEMATRSPVDVVGGTKMSVQPQPFPQRERPRVNGVEEKSSLRRISRSLLCRNHPPYSQGHRRVGIEPFDWPCLVCMYNMCVQHHFCSE